MRPFRYERPDRLASAVALYASGDSFYAGGTTMFDLMKLDVVLPERLIDLTGVRDPALRLLSETSAGLRIGALCSMAEVAADPRIVTNYPVVSQSLWLAASGQLRNMATIGGNLLQRTRCAYFRDVTYAACNKRRPGSGCEALHGSGRSYAILGVEPDPSCIATYAGDWANGLIAIGARVETTGPNTGAPIERLYRTPGTSPHLESTLVPGEIITAVILPPASGFTRRSKYLKIRDRASYAFALTSAAVALDLRDGVVARSGISLGGVGTIPWRAHAAEAILQGRRIDEAAALMAAEAALADAKPRRGSEFKPELARRTLMRALLETTVAGASSNG